MAFPVVREATAPTATTTPSTPASTQVGDLIVVLLWTVVGAGVPTHTLQLGWSEEFSHSHDDGSTDGRLSVAYKVASQAGAQVQTPYISSSVTGNLAGVIVLQAGTFDPADPFLGTPVTLTTTNNAAPNPPSHTTLGSVDALVLAIGAWHYSASTTTTVTVPTSYTAVTEVAGAATGELAVARRNVNAASEDPAAWGDNTTPNGAVAATIAVRPVSPATGPIAQTLPTLGQTGAAAITNHAAGAQTLPALGQDVDGVITNHAAAAQALPALGQEVDGSAIVTAGSAQSLPALTQAAEASVTDPSNTGPIAQTLPALGQDVEATATGGPAVTMLPTLGQAAVAAAVVPAAAAQGLPALEQAAEVQVVAVAAGAQQLPALGQAATVEHFPPAEGAVESNLPGLVSTAAGSMIDHAEVNQQLPALGSVVDAEVRVPGGALQYLPALGQAAEAFSIGGPTEGTMPALVQSAAALVTFPPVPGSGDTVLPFLTQRIRVEPLPTQRQGSPGSEPVDRLEGPGEPASHAGASDPPTAREVDGLVPSGRLE